MVFFHNKLECLTMNSLIFATQEVHLNSSAIIFLETNWSLLKTLMSKNLFLRWVFILREQYYKPFLMTMVFC